MKTSTFGVVVLLAILGSGPASAQSTPAGAWAVRAASDYRVVPDLTYFVASNKELKLDIYQRNGAATPEPTLVFFHGGFWAGAANSSN